MYLNKTDFNAVAKDNTIQQIAIGTYPTPELITSERFAVDEAAAYLNFKYNVAAIFGVNSYDFDALAAYKTGEVIMDGSGNPYNCVADAPAATLLADTNFFAAGDIRNSLIIMILADITLYHYHSRTAANRIPEMRIVRYEQAIDKLKEIRKSNLNPDLPLRDYEDPAYTEQEKTHTISIDSQPKRNNNY